VSLIDADKFRRFARALLPWMTCITLVSCMKLDRSALRNRCARSADCNQGRVCVDGICQAAVPAFTGDAGDADGDRGDGPDGPVVDGGGLDRAELHRSGPANDGGPDSDGPDSPEIGDGGADDGLDSAMPADGEPIDAATPADSHPPPPDPCVPSPADGPPASGDLARAIVGNWRLCPGADANADLRWLVGESGLIQLGPTRWWRIQGAQGSGDQVPAGLYFRVLEGSKSVFHFVDTNVGVGAGADLSLQLFSGSGALDLMSCDGVVRCSGPTGRLVPVGPLPGGG